MVRILVVDDDPKLRSYVCMGLQDSGIECEQAHDGSAALAAVDAHPASHFDLLLLDVMMPEQNGWQVLERMRERGDQTPAIFLTARDAVEERVKGLAIGADDYIIKPFDFSELLARIDAVLRRRASPTKLKYGPVSIDLLARKVSMGERDYELAAKEFDLLVALVKASGAIVTRTELLKRVWGIEFDPETNLVDVYIARVRRRLSPHGARLIRTQRGEGYYLRAGQNE